MQYSSQGTPALFAPPILDNRNVETFQHFPHLPFFAHDANLALAHLAQSMPVAHHQPSESVLRAEGNNLNVPGFAQGGGDVANHSGRQSAVRSSSAPQVLENIAIQQEQSANNVFPVGSRAAEVVQLPVEGPSHEEVKAVLHMNQTEAAKVLGISDAKLRTLQRAIGLKRWPGRKLNSVMNHKKSKVTGTTFSMVRAVGSFANAVEKNVKDKSKENGAKRSMLRAVGSFDNALKKAGKQPAVKPQVSKTAKKGAKQKHSAKNKEGNVELAKAVTEAATACPPAQERGTRYPSGGDENLLMLAEIACGQGYQ